MTAKRFTETLSTGIVTDHVTGKEYDCEMRISDDLLNLLNKLHEENEELKEAVYSWSKSYNRVYEEKESLKEQKKFLQNKIKTYKNGNALLKKTLDKEWK